MKKLNKKAVSPLIATVLLIAFAVALGALVMNWGREYIEATQEKVTLQSEQQTSCTFDTSISLVNIGDKPCFDPQDNNFYAIIENGDYELAGYKVTIFANNSIYENETTAVIKRVESKIIKAGLPPGITSIQKVTIIPKIKIKGGKEDVYCPNAKIDIDDVPKLDSCSG
jgi:flagellin-like protein